MVEAGAHRPYGRWGGRSNPPLSTSNIACLNTTNNIANPNPVSYMKMYYYVIPIALSSPIDRLNSITYKRAYITLIFYLLCLYHGTCIHLSFIHLYAPKTILIIIYFQNRWSHDNIGRATYVLMGSP